MAKTGHIVEFDAADLRNLVGAAASTELKKPSNGAVDASGQKIEWLGEDGTPVKVDRVRVSVGQLAK